MKSSLPRDRFQYFPPCFALDKVKKKKYTEFIYIPINLYTHNLWKARNAKTVCGEVSEARGGFGWDISLLIEAKRYRASLGAPDI